MYTRISFHLEKWINLQTLKYNNENVIIPQVGGIYLYAIDMENGLYRKFVQYKIKSVEYYYPRDEEAVYIYVNLYNYNNLNENCDSV